MFTKSKIGSIIENGVWGIILGAILVAWVLPMFGIAGIAAWIGGVVGAILGVIYGAASGGDDE
jgi:hypothetical protein